MCDYQGYEFCAGSYPDSVCIDGRLLDADNSNRGAFDDFEPPAATCNDLTSGD